MKNNLKTASKLVQDQFNKAEELADEINNLTTEVWAGQRQLLRQHSASHQFDKVVDAVLILDALACIGMKLAPDTGAELEADWDAFALANRSWV